jgi:hypothetical protein
VPTALRHRRERREALPRFGDILPRVIAAWAWS